SQRDLPVKGPHSAIDGGGVSANVSHAPNEWPDNLHEDIGPDFLVKPAPILDAREGIIHCREDLPVKHVVGDCRQVHCHLENLLQVGAARHALLTKRCFYARSVEGYKIDDVWEAGRKTHQSED